MSSADEAEGGRPVESKKKRKLQRACDVCKRKKIGCDGARMPGNRCSNCIVGSFDCTYVAATKKRVPSRTYVEGLERRLGKMEELLQKFVSTADLAHAIGNDTERSSWMLDTSSTAAGSSSFTNNISSPGSSMLPSARPVGQSEFSSQTEEDLDEIDEDFKHLNIGDGNGRFFGPSSSFMFLQTALDLKDEYSGKEAETSKQQSFTKQVHLWDIHPWERRTMERPDFSYNFPEDDLRIALIDLYFENFHPYLQLLHRPTFERSIEQGLHLSHRMFGATVLIVCAIASRFSDDPRVFLEGLEGREKLHSSGWKWFDQVQVVSRFLLEPPSLYELQFYCLAIMFLQGSSVPQACWTLVGIGLRLAQDAGAHRRRPPGSKPTVESESWKRAFWLLICIDTSICALLGRSCCMSDENFDLDLPLLCDDEYWEHSDPDEAFKQPPAGKPPIVACLNTYISLNVVLRKALCTIYPIRKSKIIGEEQKIVADLDSALNQWMDSVPEHLRWDPNREDEMLFNQSALLYANYYYVQILIHRPFISYPRKPSVLSFPSLAICTNAARSCCHVMDIQRRRGPLAFPHVQSAVFTAGVVLLLHVWGGQRVGLASNKSKGVEDVNKCIQVLRDQETRWHSGSRFCNILYGLAAAGNITFPDDPLRNKRERDADSSISIASPLSDQSFPYTPERPRSIAGPWRGVSKEAPPVPSTAPTDGNLPQHGPFTLPMNSDELGRLPVYAQSDFENYTGPLSVNHENTWESTLFDVPLFDANPSGHIPGTGGNILEELPMDFSTNDMFYDQMASVFSGWKGPVPDLPYEQATIPRPYQYDTSLGALPTDGGHLSMPLYGASEPVAWDGSHNWSSTYSSLQGGNDALQD